MKPEQIVELNPLGVEPVSKLVRKFAIPSVVCLVVNALYNIVDQIFIGWGIGYLGNAATNVVFPLVMLVMAVGAMLGDGCATYFSLQLGKGDRKAASKGVCNALILIIGGGILITALSLIFLEPLLHMFGATDQNLSYAMEYGFFIALGFPFMVIDVALSAIVRADGSPVYTMVGLLAGCMVNVILDPIFIFVCNWGMTGAAIATIAGQILNAVILIVYLRKIKHADLQKEYFRLKSSVVKKVFGFGMPSFILQISIVLVVAVSNNMLVHYGALSKYGSDIPLATMGITMKVNQIVINIVQGIATGSQPIIGYNYGAKNYERTKQTYRLMVICATVAMAIAFIIFQFFPMAVVSLFGSESNLYNEFAVKCLRIFLLLCIVNGFQMCTGILFQAVGKPVLAAINVLMKMVIIVVPATVILSVMIGVDGTLWAGPLADGIAFIFALILLKLNWEKIFPKNKDGSLPEAA